jgi:hypothetical protein
MSSPVARAAGQVVQALRGVAHPQLASRHFLNQIWQLLGEATLPDGLNSHLITS